jgi:hypothetical protein
MTSFPKATNREVTEMADKHALREQSVRYNSDFGAKNTGLRLNNSHFWDDLRSKSISYPGPTRRWSVGFIDAKVWVSKLFF